ncbi:efflux RND transporter periplasmic adaptor subunit [Sabulilitoribacter arenilitoris]|uniref:Efflux RND transporter periplasmic adaptor subunit n=1 Tax=Wocania arenilitoris TaxID=2044858 RepID=A0AAE3JM49_9FLAO|nr:efflux RND transporter periplasmic adaptor subunit [Wocania arenilitoris]MCF7567411.1 efflux RND transporter periplasmic adaptor subunit [Wocania arenilitoris]
MQKIYSLLIVTIVLTSCGGDKKASIEDIIATDNLEQIRQYKTQLDSEQQTITSQLKRLEAKIKELDPQEKIPLITTIEAKEAVFMHFLELQGNVSTKENILIYPEFSGVLSTVYVKEGQRVSKGQVLARIDDGGLNQQLAQLKIQTALAKTTFERQERLWNQNIGSEIQYLQSKATYEAQEQAVNQLQNQVLKTVVRAPFTGTIDDVITEQGSVVAPGSTPLFRIVNLQNMYIETDVPERYISDVVAGKDVLVNFTVLNIQVDAKVRQAGNFINPANRTFKIQVGLDNKDKSIKPNLTAKLKINDYTNDKAILIPQSIISENAKGEQYVYTISDKSENKGVVNRVIIETGKTQGDNIEVLSGIKDGTEIVNEGARSVKDGQEVKIIEFEASK